MIELNRWAACPFPRSEWWQRRAAPAAPVKRTQAPRLKTRRSITPAALPPGTPPRGGPTGSRTVSSCAPGRATRGNERVQVAASGGMRFPVKNPAPVEPGRGDEFFSLLAFQLFSFWPAAYFLRRNRSRGAPRNQYLLQLFNHINSFPRQFHRTSMNRWPLSISLTILGNNGANHACKARLEQLPIRSQTTIGAGGFCFTRAAKSSSLVNKINRCFKA